MLVVVIYTAHIVEYCIVNNIKRAWNISITVVICSCHNFEPNMHGQTTRKVVLHISIIQRGSQWERLDLSTSYTCFSIPVLSSLWPFLPTSDSTIQGTARYTRLALQFLIIIFVNSLILESIISTTDNSYYGLDENHIQCLIIVIVLGWAASHSAWLSYHIVVWVSERPIEHSNCKWHNF